MHQLQRNSHKFTIHLDQVWFPPNLGNLMIPENIPNTKIPVGLFWQHFFRQHQAISKGWTFHWCFFPADRVYPGKFTWEKNISGFLEKVLPPENYCNISHQVGKIWKIIFSKCQFFWGICDRSLEKVTWRISLNYFLIKPCNTNKTTPPFRDEGKKGHLFPPAFQWQCHCTASLDLHRLTSLQAFGSLDFFSTLCSSC